MRTEGEFAEHELWLTLAKNRGLRLPLWRVACSSSAMTRWLKKLGIDQKEYLERNNDRTVIAFSRHNPDWPLRAWIGLQLEWLDEDWIHKEWKTI